MNTKYKELKDFIKTIEDKGVITFKEYEELKNIISKIYLKIDELQKRGDHFKELYFETKDKLKDKNKITKIIEKRIEETKLNIKINEEGINLNDNNLEYHRWNKSANDSLLRLLEELLSKINSHSPASTDKELDAIRQSNSANRSIGADGSSNSKEDNISKLASQRINILSEVCAVRLVDNKEKENSVCECGHDKSFHYGSEGIDGCQGNEDTCNCLGFIPKKTKGDEK